MTVRDHVRALRFSDDVPATAAFYETLGLVRSEQRGTGWVVLRAGRGDLALHDAATSDTGAAAGETRLGFVTDDADALAAALRAADPAREVSVHDEAYGRAVVTRAPDGGEVRADEPGDGHGYDRSDAAPDVRWTLRPVWYLAPDLHPAARDLLAVLGLEARPGGSPFWTACDGPGGAIGLHGPLEGRPRCEVGLETAEPLDDVAARLRAAGHDAEVTENPRAGRLLRTTDPDGRAVEVHAAP